MNDDKKNKEKEGEGEGEVERTKRRKSPASFRPTTVHPARRGTGGSVISFVRR